MSTLSGENLSLYRDKLEISDNIQNRNAVRNNPVFSLNLNPFRYEWYGISIENIRIGYLHSNHSEGKDASS